MDAKLAVATDRAREMMLFADVIGHSSFFAASRVLGLTPSAAAHTIDRIEYRLGVRSLLRSTSALALTAEGQFYLRAARRIVADLDDAEQQIADLARRTVACGSTQRYRMDTCASCRFWDDSPSFTPIS